MRVDLFHRVCFRCRWFVVSFEIYIPEPHGELSRCEPTHTVSVSFPKCSSYEGKDVRVLTVVDVDHACSEQRLECAAVRSASRRTRIPYVSNRGEISPPSTANVPAELPRRRPLDTYPSSSYRTLTTEKKSEHATRVC